MRMKPVLLLALLFTICITASSLNSYVTPSVAGTAHPRGAFAPPSTQSGTGYSIDLADSVNGWQSKNLATGNTLPTCQSPYRDTTFNQLAPSGFSVAWQNLSVSKLTATPDLREVQYAASSTNYLTARKGGTGPMYAQLGMRFRPVDAVNLTSVWMYYYSEADAQLQVVSKNATASDTPQGGKVVATSTLLANVTVVWREVKFSNPVSLVKGNYYWIIVNASNMIPSKDFRWFYIDDPGGVMDQQPAATYNTTLWLNEVRLHSTGLPYLNFMLVLKVLPVVNGNPSKVMTYSSPAQVNMRELNSGTPISKNVTQIPPSTHKFTLGTNTSVTFLENWTARFVKYQPGMVQTIYTAQAGLTSWTALFASTAKPSNLYTWYNRTLRVTSIPLDWQIDPVSNVTNDNNINFTASYSIGLSYITIRQTDNVTVTPIWDSNWVIAAASPYSITASAPLQAILGQRFNISIAAPLVLTHCNITVYDSTDTIVLMRGVLFPSSSPNYFPIRLNQTGNFVITLFDKADYAPEVSYLVMPTIVSVPALTSFNLQSPTLRATWGDIVTITFSCRNTTLGSDKEFPAPPDVMLSTEKENFTIKNIQASGSGWFSFSFETRFLPSSGGYILTIRVSYGGSYLNQETMTLQLDPPGISPLMIVLAGGGSGGAVIAVVAARRYLAGRKAKEEEKVKILKQTASLAQLVVVHLGSGRAAYSRSLGTEESVDPNLISGFLTANQSIMSQVFKGKAPSGLKFADYGEYKVISHVGKYVMSSLFCTEAAGEELQSVLEKFTEEFESKYEKELGAWDGNVDLFKGADGMVDRVFSLRLISPYILVLDRLARVKLSGVEKAVVDNARRLSAARGIFFMPRIIDFLLTSKKVKRSKIVDIIDSLVKKGVFKQLTVDEAAQIISLTEYDSKTTDDAIGDLLDNGR